MPEICRFFGIVIAMFYDEHNPPHFHVRYESHKASMKISDLTVLDGSLPPRVVGLVVEWALTHKDELMMEWEAARGQKPLFTIEPLK